MKLLKQIETLFQAGSAAGLTDGQLLDRFIAHRDETAEAAFAALVDRHGSMVLRVCRQVLGDEHDAQDASQATFLVLARRAGSIGRRESVASWLHGVALRVAAMTRRAASRRRARERRGGEQMAARHAVEVEIGAKEDPERWAKLHDELGRLPDSFREPLVLCYLEGLTQEQAAAQLRCPLGTVQSRLARGRAKLKARLTKQGFDQSDAFAGALLLARQPASAPEAWAEATVRLAMQFTQTTGPVAAATVSAAILAEEVLRAMVLTKLKVALGLILFAAVLISGAATWAQHQGKPAPLVAQNQVAIPKKSAEPARFPKEVFPPPGSVTRTIRGVVKNEQGRPIPKVWVGSDVTWSEPRWEIIQPSDRIRERKEPFHDEKGKVVPPGALGKYFELRDELGNWRAVHPDDIGRYDRPLELRPTPFRDVGVKLPPMPFQDDVEFANDVIAKGRDVFGVRTAQGRWQISPLFFKFRRRDSQESLVFRPPADRTDAHGNFEVEVMTNYLTGAAEVHFASLDFTRQAVHVVRNDDPERPLEIRLKPVRLVRARVIETPVDNPRDNLDWAVYAFDSTVENGYYIPAMGEKGAHWASGAALGNSENEPRRFEVALPVGRYRFRFGSDTVLRLVDLVIPAGDGPLDLPDFQLETLAGIKMFGKPAAEIEAVDLEGKPVKLADYRGKVVVLAFVSSPAKDYDAYFDGTPLKNYNAYMLGLIGIIRRFKDQPLAILALHDASIPSLTKYQEALKPLRNQVAGEIPLHLLLDRRPITAGTGPYALGAGEEGSGRTRDTYEIVDEPAVYVIDKNGKLVFGVRGDGVSTVLAIGKEGRLVRDSVKYTKDDGADRKAEMARLKGALEDQFGLERSRPAEPAERAPAISRDPEGMLVLKGKVVDLDGKPIAGARLTELYDRTRNPAVTTGPTGEFTYDYKQPDQYSFILVEASGMASQVFRFEYTPFKHPLRLAFDGIWVRAPGIIEDPLKMGPGVEVTGRLVHGGKPISGSLVGLECCGSDFGPAVQYSDTRTDDQGKFRFPHVLSNTEFSVYAKLGSLKDDGTIDPRRFRTGKDGTTTELGDFESRPGLTLAGKVVFSDGSVAPKDSVLTVSPEYAGRGLAKLDTQGRFVIRGLPAGTVAVGFSPVDDNDSGKMPSGYCLSLRNRCLDLQRPHLLVGRLDHDISDLTILFERDTGSRYRIVEALDPTVLAEYFEAQSGPITGVSPKDDAKGH